MHSRHSQVQGAGVGKRASCHQRGHHGSGHLVGERGELFVSIRTNNSTPDIQHRLRGFSDHLRCDLDLLGVCLDHRVVTGEVNLWWPDKRRRLLLGILGDVHQNGAWATRGRDVNGGSDHSGNFFRLRDQERVLGDRHRDTGDIDLLERVGSHRGGEHLTCDGQQRDRVHVGISDSGHQVGSPWSRGGNTHTEFPRGCRIAFSRVTGTLLVTNEDVANLVSGRHELVIERHDRSTGQAKNVLDTEQLKALENCARARQNRRLGRQLGLALFLGRQLWSLLVQSVERRITHVFTAFSVRGMSW